MKEEIVPPPPPPITVEHVKNEAQRRIIEYTGASDINRCFAKQLNASMRATELTLIEAQGGTWTQEQADEAAALQALADGIKAIRAKSDLIEQMDPIPSDYASNEAYWS